MKFAIIVFSAIIFSSCSKKEEDVFIPYSEATYKVTLSMNWASPDFGVPAGAHVTGIIGMVHNGDTSLWRPAGAATPGLEDVAEIGNNTKMNAQLDGILLSKKALSKFTITPPSVTGMMEANITFNTDYSCISFASMIAPSPDWFMGIHDFNLFKNKQWIRDITLSLSVYDAGTEDGDAFSYNNPETSPQQSISLLTAAKATVLANGNSTIMPIGTIRFTKNQE